MKSKLIELPKFSGKKASIYSIVTEDSKVPFFNHFIAEHRNEYEQDLISIAKRLRSIGSTVGAREIYFKLDEGVKWNDLVCALYDEPDRHLRLYCIRLSENIIIVGNGGPKDVRAWQEDIKLSKEVHEMMHYSSIIRKKLKDGSLRISEDGMRFEGDLMLTR